MCSYKLLAVEKEKFLFALGSAEIRVKPDYNDTLFTNKYFLGVQIHLYQAQVMKCPSNENF